MQVYAIREKGTDNYMPGVKPSKRGGNFSFHIPQPGGGGWGRDYFLLSSRQSIP